MNCDQIEPCRITCSNQRASPERNSQEIIVQILCAYNNQAGTEICNSHVLFISHTHTKDGAADNQSSMHQAHAVRACKCLRNFECAEISRVAMQSLGSQQRAELTALPAYTCCKQIKRRLPFAFLGSRAAMQIINKVSE